MFCSQEEIYQIVGELFMANRILSKQIESLVKANEELKKDRGDISETRLSGTGSVERPGPSDGD